MGPAESMRTTVRGCPHKQEKHITHLLLLVLHPGLEHLVEAGGSEPPCGVKEDDVLPEAEGHAGRDAEAHLEQYGPVISCPPVAQ